MIFVRVDTTAIFDLLMQGQIDALFTKLAAKGLIASVKTYNIQKGINKKKDPSVCLGLSRVFNLMMVAVLGGVH